MNDQLQQLCDQVIENRNVLKRNMIWEVDSSSYAIMAALMYAAKGIRADSQKYKDCKKILHSNISVFSEVRGFAQAVVITKMTMADDPTAYIQGVNAVYKKLRAVHKLTASANMVMAAVNIYEHVGVEGADADIEKLEELYKSLKQQHPFLIFDEDRPYLSMLIASGLDIQETVNKIEASYEECKKISIHKDALHSLAQLLAFSPTTAEENRDFTEKMIRGLTEQGVKFSRAYGLPALGALALLNMPVDDICHDIAEADAYLKAHKGFKWFNVTPRIRAIFSMLVVFIAYAKGNTELAASISSTITMTIAEEIIMAIVIMSTMSTIHNSSSSSSSSGAN